MVALHQTPGVTNARGGAERCRPSPPDRTQSDPHPGRWEGRARYKPQLVALRRALSSLDDNRCRFPDLRGPPAGVTHNCPNSHSLKGQGRDSLTARRPQAVLPTISALQKTRKLNFLETKIPCDRQIYANSTPTQNSKKYQYCERRQNKKNRKTHTHNKTKSQKTKQNKKT